MKQGDVAAVRKALERKDGDVSKALMSVFGIVDEKTQCEIARLLIDAGAKTDARSLHNHCCVALMQLLVKASDDSSVNWKCHRGENTPLHFQAAFGLGANSRLLTDAKADVNAVNDRGDTPLMCAVRVNQKDTISVLLAAGADLSITNKRGETALSLAIGECKEILQHTKVCTLFQPTPSSHSFL